MAQKTKKQLPKKTGTKKSLADSSKSLSFKLFEILDISYAEKFKNEIIQLLENSVDTGVTLDASGVNRITTPCIQVLLSLSKSASMARINFKILSPSANFSKAFNDLGLSKELNGWVN